MKLGIMQPYFLPYIGYFQLMKLVDQYVIYDDVNYIKGGWISRNNLLIGNEKKMFTTILKGASPNKLINEIEIGDDFRKFKKMIDLNYSKAPYYLEIRDLIERITSFEDRNLALFIGNSLEVINKYLNIDTPIIYSSNINKDNNLRGVDRVLDICSILNAETYINAIGGKNLYDKNLFRSKSVDLCFLESKLKPYKQFSDTFIEGLSIIDVLMFNSVQDSNLLLDDFVLS